MMLFYVIKNKSDHSRFARDLSPLKVGGGFQGKCGGVLSDRGIEAAANRICQHREIRFREFNRAKIVRRLKSDTIK